MQILIDLVKANQSYLVKRVLYYAKLYDYVKYTSTLEEAWIASVFGLSNALVSAVSFESAVPEIKVDHDFLSDPISSFGVIEAKKHRLRGVSLEMFMGLMKYYRQSYLDLVKEYVKEIEQQTLYMNWINRFFDRNEISFCSEWTNNSKDEIIMELQATNRSLTNEKNKFLTIFESISSPAIIMDTEQNCMNINHSAQKLLSRNVQSPGFNYYSGMKNKSRLEAIFPWICDDFLEFCSSDKLEASIEKDVETITCGKRSFLVSFQRMLDVSGKFEGTVILLNDISELKFAQEELIKAKKQAEAANVLKSQFLATMSHEIRTPLNGVLGMAQLLMMPELEERERDEYVQTIFKSGQTLLTILNDILDISKIESGHIELENIDFRPEELIREIAALYYERIISKGIKVEVCWNGPVDSIYISDTVRIKQMLSNFISNALKFTSQGTIQIEGRIIETLGMESLLEFSVKDSGIGIPLDRIDRLFKPFSQIDSSITRKYGGTGLGLSIVSSLAKIMGGEVGVESKQKTGSKFWFTVRVNNAKVTGASRENKEPNKIIIKNNIFSDCNILIVEDNVINCKVVEAMLKSLNTSFQSVSNGQEAVEKIFAGEIPDLILMDCQMPVMDGYTATRIIRGWEERNMLPRIPIIALTANAFAEDREKCIAAGMDDFLAKPLVMTKLFNMLEDWIDRSDYEQTS